MTQQWSLVRRTDWHMAEEMWSIGGPCGVGLAVRRLSQSRPRSGGFSAPAGEAQKDAVPDKEMTCNRILKGGEVVA